MEDYRRKVHALIDQKASLNRILHAAERWNRVSLKSDLLTFQLRMDFPAQTFAFVVTLVSVVLNNQGYMTAAMLGLICTQSNNVGAFRKLKRVFS